eukprot:TRINITY_DN32128_c0_g1_i1.p1 TRINITY_DN32128_c0_g1~~TRINITY_DN32128_c0_g1_i1.p1  ORF type:complete len:577 (-),score=136.50 TRINITY_DN32128_c0_g1_i1:96-1784(-)
MTGNDDQFVIIKHEDEGEDETDSAGSLEPLTVIKEDILPETHWIATQTQATTPLRLKLTDSLLSLPGNSESTSSLPSTEIWPGDHNFAYEIEDSGNWKKRGYAYSSLLNKLYVDMEKQVALKFYISSKLLPESVIRAVPVYVDIASRSQPVLRCPVHSSLEDPSNRATPSPILKHLVRSSETSTQYFENQTSGRLSLTTAVKDQAPGCDYFTTFYQFMCLGSCLGGLARRQLQMIFTLETQQGKVLGRQVMEVRICSCPLRDMKQEEQKYSKHNPTAKVSPKRSAPIQIRNTQSLPSAQGVSLHLPVLPQARTPDTQSTYGKDDDIFWVPVRGIENYGEVNKFAEYLDLTRGGSCLPEGAMDLRKQRDQFLAAANPKLARFMKEKGDSGSKSHSDNDNQVSEPETKRRKLSSDPHSHLPGLQAKVTSSNTSQTASLPAVSAMSVPGSLLTRFQPIMPKPTILENHQTIYPRNPHTILLQPKKSLTGNHHSEISLEGTSLPMHFQTFGARNIQQVESSRQPVKVEDSEDWEEGEMTIADSLNINSEDSNDGLNELRNKIVTEF